MSIQGGYILQPRSIDESDFAKLPPHVREIWFYILRNANHADANVYGTIIKRGQLLTRYSDILEALSWQVGFRKESYKNHHCETAMKLLTKRNMVTITKTTRGLIITVCKYDYYQDPKNYENYNENRNKAGTEPEESHTINKKKKNKKNDNKDSISNEILSDTLQHHSESINYEQLVNWFNENTKGVFGQIRIPLSQNRKNLIKARIREHGKEVFCDAVKRAYKSNFLKGDNGRGFKATFDWIIKPTNFEKIISGNYDNNKDKSGNGENGIAEELARNVAEGIARANYQKSEREL